MYGQELNPQVKVFEEFENRPSSDKYSNQIVETGRFDQGLGSTLKKTPNYTDFVNNSKDNNGQNNAIIVPELNLSPRCDSDEHDVEVIKNNQRKLFENI